MTSLALPAAAAPQRSASSEQPAPARRRRRDRAEFRLYFWLTFPLFLLIAIAARLLPPARRPFADGRRSVLGDARAAAHTILPFVFMA